MPAPEPPASERTRAYVGTLTIALDASRAALTGDEQPFVTAINADPPGLPKIAAIAALLAAAQQLQADAQQAAKDAALQHLRTAQV